MKLIKKYKLVLFLLFCCIYYSFSSSVRDLQITPNLPKFGTFSSNSFQEIYGPIVLLQIKDTHERFCTGTVIDDNYVLTAAHCVVNGSGSLISNTLTLSSPNIIDTTLWGNVDGQAVTKSSRMDLALVKGNFIQFRKLPILFNGEANFGEDAVACGYPNTQSTLFCVKVQNIIPYGFKLIGGGMLIPGMSGGPVFQNINGKLMVVAVNFAIDEELAVQVGRNVMVSPVIGLFGLFNIEPDNK